ncbi:MAG: CDP-diacylglycerol--serine O-phosphatidyltransferase [Geminicoccaceae bacterium]
MASQNPPPGVPQRAGRFRRRRLRPQPVLHFVPNMFTILGLCAGMTGIRYAFDGRWQLAVGFILAAAVFDGLDGRSARLLKMTSKLGEQLDSLADFLSFGVAPAIIVYLWVLHDVRGLGWAVALVFATCCALRLARFNAELDAPERPRWALYFFTGVPAPAAAGLALLPIMASFVIGSELVRAWWLNGLVLVTVAVLMVSRVPTFSVKRLRIKPALVIPTMILGVFVAVLLVTEVWLMLTLVGLAYLLSIPVSWRLAARMGRESEAAMPEPEPVAASDTADAATAEDPAVYRLGSRHTKP